MLYRRALWNLLRVEWENIKHNRGSKEGDDDEMESEYDPFISSPSNMDMSPRAAQKKDRQHVQKQ
jgi:hypothetical protein